MEVYEILIIALVVISVIYLAFKFFGLPIANKRSIIEAWLLQAVILAEKEFNSGNGQIKFSIVYDKFIGKFPIISMLMPKSMFEKLVDSALDEMRKNMEKDKSLNWYLKG